MLSPESSIFRIVLVRPKFPSHIGAVARVAANFGISDIRVVSPEPECVAWRNNEEARKLAVAHAREVFESIREHSRLEEALKGTLSSYALTRRPGRSRSSPRPYFEWIPAALQSGGITAWVFGNETMGLSEEETLLCSESCFIPTSSQLGSMNLSHAVAVVASRVHEALSPLQLEAGLANPRQRASPHSEHPAEAPALHEQKEALYLHWKEALIATGMTDSGNPDRTLRGIREILESRALKLRDVSLLRGFLSHVLRSSHPNEGRSE